MKEIFKPVIGHEGLYEVSDHGRIFSLPKRWGRHNNRHHGLIEMKYSESKYGYLTVLLTKNRKAKTITVHLLVWDAFGDKPRNGHKAEVDHIDNNKKNNSISNLQILSSRRNTIKKWESKKELPVGVHLRKDTKKYQALITIKNKHYSLGCFPSPIQAQLAYNKKLLQLGELR